MSLTDIEESKNGGAQAHRAVAVGEVTPLDDEARNDAADRGRQGHMRSERVAGQVTVHGTIENQRHDGWGGRTGGRRSP